MILTLICVVLCFILAYFYLTETYGYWRKWNVPHDKPKLFFGSIKDGILRKKSMIEEMLGIYEKYKDCEYIGYYQMKKPVLILTNLETIQTIVNKDMQFFWKNELQFDEETDRLAALSPFFSTGQLWWERRNQMSALFTSAKLKHLFPLLHNPTAKLVEYLKKHNTTEAREVLTSYIADASALSAFSIDGESFDNPNAPYKTLGQQVMKPGGKSGLKFVLLLFFPRVARLLGVTFVPKDLEVFLRRTIEVSLKHREGNSSRNNDFLDTMIKMKNERYTDENIVAHSLAFISEPNVAITASFVLYELASNRDAQEKLREEIETVLKRYDGKVTYDAVQEMSYLECVVNESMRLHPAVPVLMKRCTGYYEFPRADGGFVPVEPGMSVLVPTMGFHLSEKYFEEPTRFVPDRFSEKNKSKIVNGSYMPFGSGKRICVGMKLAMIMMKIPIIEIVRNFVLTVNERTITPLQMDPDYPVMLAKGGIWLNFEPRKD